ncbi:MAG TPA: preprotein translocase subunit SecE [Candidatus Pacearchaeota archaeon]|nr:preprotein translocase subunit SecE [Candidatus Pacearchaeota archaeon]HPR80151.1 preprotein translocase subunit SecE [Candidatus Pacearchaeota archaeon]
MKSENKVSNFFGSTWSETKKITWPTRQETIKYTITVIGICIIVAGFLGLCDLLYIYLMEHFIF